MAARPKWSNSISLIGIPLTDHQRNQMAATWEHFCDMYLHVHGCHPTRKEFIVALLMVGCEEIIKVTKPDLIKALMSRSGAAEFLTEG